MADRLITVEDLRVSFMTASGEIQAVRGVDFYLDRGETLAIVGESGCGKSVTVQTIMRLLQEPPALIKSGSIRYTNGDVDMDIATRTDKQMRAYRGKEFSMIFQDAMTSLNPTTRVGRQIVEGILRHQDLSSREAKERTIKLLSQTGLPAPETVYNRYPHTLSGGQRQRVMIAMALSCNPAVLFADEPTTALDVTIQAQILNLMNDIKRQRNMSIIFITHNLGVVARMADRVAVMYAGQIVEAGSLRDIFYRPRHPYTWGLLGSVPDLRMNLSTRLASIPGTPPDLFAPPAGCPFAARCAWCMKACMDVMPGEYPVSEGHMARCWLLDRECETEVIPPVGRDKTVFKTDRKEEVHG
ncbi:MAG: ABC transporter ATP-binding protein [Lachnospiraceae bacterium]|jgi:oligopeptide transport system ATP-binding protein|nr:ABC transporter ATP-binding protein [Lachnospiraceae bacterium]